MGLLGQTHTWKPKIRCHCTRESKHACATKEIIPIQPQSRTFFDCAFFSGPTSYAVLATVLGTSCFQSLIHQNLLGQCCCSKPACSMHCSHPEVWRCRPNPESHRAAPQTALRSPPRCAPYVAMHQPGSRVVGLEGKNEVPRCWQHGRVTTRWVIGVERHTTGGEATGALGENGKFESVEVNWMRNWQCRLNNDICPFTPIRELDYCVRGVEGCNIVSQLQQRRIRPVN